MARGTSCLAGLCMSQGLPQCHLKAWAGQCRGCTPTPGVQHVAELLVTRVGKVHSTCDLPQNTPGGTAKVCRVPQCGQSRTTEVCGGTGGGKAKVSHFLSKCSTPATADARDLHHQSSHSQLGPSEESPALHYSLTKTPLHFSRSQETQPDLFWSLLLRGTKLLNQISDSECIFPSAWENAGEPQPNTQHSLAESQPSCHQPRVTLPWDTLGKLKGRLSSCPATLGKHRGDKEGAGGKEEERNAGFCSESCPGPAPATQGEQLPL